MRCLCFRAEIQTKRQERKRRSTANPTYSGLFEPEVRTPLPVRRRLTVTVDVCADTFPLPVCLQRKRLASHYLNSSLFLAARGKTRLNKHGTRQRTDRTNLQSSRCQQSFVTTFVTFQILHLHFSLVILKLSMCDSSTCSQSEAGRGLISASDAFVCCYMLS